jgi:hypothetical protein
MTVELNGELIAEYLDQRELYIGATMIKRRQDEESGEAPNTYLGLAVAEPVGRFGVKPMVTGSGPVVLPGPAWCHDPTGQEPPLNFSIDEVGAALGGAGGSHEPVGNGVEVSGAVSGGQASNSDGEQR